MIGVYELQKQFLLFIMSIVNKLYNRFFTLVLSSNSQVAIEINNVKMSRNKEQIVSVK